MQNVELHRSAFVDVPVTRYVADMNDFVADHKYTSEEVYFDIELNGEPLTTAFCSPLNFEDLIVGMLAQMGRIRTFDDITECTPICLCQDDERGAGMGGGGRAAAALFLGAAHPQTASGGNL